MTYQQASELRRAARRDDDLSDTAYRLFCEVIDLHMLPDGCTARDATFAHWIGASERTIQRRRTELEEAGYLAVEGRGATRTLVPKAPDLSSKVANMPNLSDKSGEPELAKNGEHKEYIYTPESERARAREADPSTTQQKEGSQQTPAQREVPDANDVPAEVAAIPLPHHAPSYRQVVQQAEFAGLPESEAKKFYLYYAGENFETRHGRPINWQAKLGRWRMRWKTGEFQSDTEKKKRANGISQMW